MDLLANLRSRLPSRNSRPDLAGNQAVLDGIQILDQAGFLVAEIDRAGLIQSANSRLCRMRGAEIGDVLGTGLAYLVTAVERSDIADLIHTVFSGLQGGEVVARLLTTNGSPMPTIRWALLPLTAGDGTSATALCVGTDLTAHIAPPAPPRAEPEDSADLEALRAEAEKIEKENQRLQKELKHLATAPPAAPPPPVPDHLVEAEDDSPGTLAQLERRHVFHTLKETSGRVSGPKGAAARLGLHPNTLRSRMEKLGIGKVG